MHRTNHIALWLIVLTTALAPVIWGSTYIVATELLPVNRPFTAALLRALPAGLLLVLFTRRVPKPNEWLRLIFLSALNIAIFQALLFIAAYKLPGGLAAVIIATQPLLVLGVVWLIEHRRPAPLSVLASIAGIAGVAMLLFSSSSAWNSIGIAAALLSAISMAVGIYLTRRWSIDLPILAFTGWQLLLSGLMLAPLAWALDPPLPVLQTTHIFAYSYLSLGGALFAYSIWFWGISQLSPVAVSSLSLLSPLTAVILGWVYLDQTMTGVSLVGGIAILASVITLQWAQNHVRPETSKAKLP